MNTVTIGDLTALCQGFPGFLRPTPMNDDHNGPCYRLTFDDAVDIWLRHWAGQFQSRIAAHYDVNQARVNEVLKE